jgi:serine/threonine protein kinase
MDPTNDEKVSLDNFQFIKRLGEGGYGTVVLTQGKLPGRPKQPYAIKALKKKESLPSASLRSLLRRKP